jgi:hypothetical protein
VSDSKPQKRITLNSWLEFMRDLDAATTFHDYRSAFEGARPFAITRELKEVLDQFSAQSRTATFAVRKGRVEAFWLDEFHNHMAVVHSKASGDPCDAVAILSLGTTTKDRQAEASCSQETQDGRQRLVSGTPHGPILDQLTAFLGSTNLKTSREAGALVVKHEHYSTRVEVVPGDGTDSRLGRIECVIHIRSDFPKDVACMLTKNLVLADSMNRMASLGALTFDDGRLFVGSRLTIFEDEAAQNIQSPLILLSIIGAVDSLMSAGRKALDGNENARETSAWTGKDFGQVKDFFSQRCVCNNDEFGFVAEFALRPGHLSAVVGHNATALWKLDGDQPHPGLGGGLFCLLQLPHRIQDRSRSGQAIRQLNRLEMLPHPLPPHFGAWCLGDQGGNPTYVSFLPNALHDIAPGIALNMTVWAEARAQWANITLASMGIAAGPEQPPR